MHVTIAVRAQLTVGCDRDVIGPPEIPVGRAGHSRIRVAGGDQHRQPGVAKGLCKESGRVAGHVILLEEIAGAGDQVNLRLACALDDPLQGGAQVAATALRANAVEALAREGPVQMQVSEMKQAKGHKSPVNHANCAWRDGRCEREISAHYRTRAEFIPNQPATRQQRLN